MQRIVLLLLLSAIWPLAAGAQDFQLGERLPAGAPAPGALAAYRELTWDDLIPASWNPEKELEGLNLDALDDGDPRAQAALDKIRAVWDSAPAEESLAGARVKLAGFVVPLDNKGDQISEFLLVPYFGACIHSPPPPANQIVHVVAASLPASFEPMDPFWVSGTLSIDHSLTDMGFSSYRLVAQHIEPFTAPPPGQ